MKKHYLIMVVWAVLNTGDCMAAERDSLSQVAIDEIPVESENLATHRFSVNSVITTGPVVAGNSFIVKAGTITLSPLSTGILQTNNDGLVTSTTGNPGQLLITNAAAVPTWGNLTSQSGTLVITHDQGAINLEIAATDNKSEACCDALPNTLVRRDALGTFAAHMITLNGAVSKPTDVVTKEYVDTVTALGLMPLQPVSAVSSEPVSMYGIQTVDGVTLAVGDRVLLTKQEEAINNGIWKVKQGNWTRTIDFAPDARAGRAYVLVTSGTTHGGSSWLCSTPKARIDSDELTFALFTLPIHLTIKNSGEGVGQLFKDKVGTTFNIKTIAQGAHIHVINNPDDITITTDATWQPKPNTLIARDEQGNFAAHVITADLQGNAATATHAVTADTATQAIQATSALNADQANYALKAGHAFQADRTHVAELADIAKQSAIADNALHAQQADKAEHADCAAHALHSDTATQAVQAQTFSEPLAGDVTGNQTNTIIVSVGGQPAVDIATAVRQVQAAVAINRPDALVVRDDQGNFSAQVVSADLLGNAATATYAAYADKALQAEQATRSHHAAVADKAIESQEAMHALSADNAVQATRAVQSEQALLADKAIQANTVTEPLAGDVTGNQTSTVVVSVAGQSAEEIAAATRVVQTATPDSSAHSLVVRDALGNFAAQMITIHNSVINPTDVATKSYVDSVTASFAGQSAEQIAIATQKIQEASAVHIPATLVVRDDQGNFAANIITADLQGNAATATKATYALEAERAVSAENATHALQADTALQADYALSANQAKKAKHAVQSNKATQADRAELADHATVADKAVEATHALQADRATCADKAVQANAFTEPLVGDVIGNHTSTVIARVGGQTAEAIATATQAVQAATSDNIPNRLIARDGDGAISATKLYADVQGNIRLKEVSQTGLIGTDNQGNLTPLHTKLHALCVGNNAHTLSSINIGATGHVLVGSTDNDPYFAPLGTNAGLTEHGVVIGQGDKGLVASTSGLDGQVLVGATGHDPVFASLTSHGGTIKITRGAHTINLETSSDNLKEFPTDTGIAIPSGGRLAIRGSQNMRVRAIGSSIIIAMNNSPAVSGSLTAGTNITAGTGLTVLSGGATITGDTKINSAGTGATTIGNAMTATALHGIVSVPDSLEIQGKASFDQGLESRCPTVIAAAELTPPLIIKNGNQQTTPLRLMGMPHAAGAPLLIDAQGNISTAPSNSLFTENIRPLTTESEKLYALEPVLFDYTSNYGACKNQYGLIAQEVEKYAPEVVIYKQDGTPYAISYHLLIPLLIKELQKQRKILHDLTACDDCKCKTLSAVKK